MVTEQNDLSSMSPLRDIISTLLHPAQVWSTLQQVSMKPAVFPVFPVLPELGPVHRDSISSSQLLVERVQSSNAARTQM